MALYQNVKSSKKKGRWVLHLKYDILYIQYMYMYVSFEVWHQSVTYLYVVYVWHITQISLFCVVKSTETRIKYSYYQQNKWCSFLVRLSYVFRFIFSSRRKEAESAFSTKRCIAWFHEYSGRDTIIHTLKLEHVHIFGLYNINLIIYFLLLAIFKTEFFINFPQPHK